MEEQQTARQLLYRWFDAVMADKVFFTANIDARLTKNIGLADNTLDNVIRIIRTAAQEIRGMEVSTGRISNILVEKHRGLWKVILFKEKKGQATKGDGNEEKTQKQKRDQGKTQSDTEAGSRQS